MRAAAFRLALCAAAAATAAQGQMRVFDAAAPVRARVGAADSSARLERRSWPHFGRTARIRGVAGGVDPSPFVTALPEEMWRGRIRSFGLGNRPGLSGTAVRARSVGFGDLRSDRPVSGFLASQLQYSIALSGDDFLRANASVALQRMPALPPIGRGTAVHVNSLFLGAALVHRQRLTLSGGWYQMRVSALTPLDYAIERTAGMPAAGQGARLALDWRVSNEATAAPAHLSLEWRDGDADRDRREGFGSGAGRERRLMLRLVRSF